MKQNECGVVRDLMPLVIDGVASEESQKLVEEHVTRCSECAESYAEMRRQLPDGETAPDAAAMEHAAKNLRFRRKIRALWAVIMSMAALMIALVANATQVAQFVDDVWYQLRYVGPENQLRLEALNVTLEWFPYGGVRLTMESSPAGNRPFRTDFQIRYDEATGEAYLQVCAYADESQERNVFYINDSAYYSEYFENDYDHMHYREGKLYFERPLTPEMHSWESIYITRIVLVYGEETVLLWEEGDGLPAYCRAGQLRRGTEAIPTPTPTPERTNVYFPPTSGGMSTGTTNPVTPTPQPTPTRSYPPRLPPHKR